MGSIDSHREYIYFLKSLRHISIAGCGIIMMLTACNGIMGGLYDEDNGGNTYDNDAVSVHGTLYVDASSWTDWYYIDLHAIRDSIVKGAEPNLTFEPWPIPTEETAAFDQEGSGIYTYWYDIFGEGVTKREYRSSYPTAKQPEPEQWDIAVHRNNVRTNGGAAAETNGTDMTDDKALTPYTTDMTGDEVNESDVWTISEKMIQSLIGNQRIKVNPVLSRWLTMEIPPMPPAFMQNDHVFLLRMKDNTYAALRLLNYISPTAVKCCLTIEYRYPVLIEN